MTNDMAAWALEQMYRLDTAVRELNEQNAALERKIDGLKLAARLDRMPPLEKSSDETPRMT